jgi:molybdopterin-containing oxidoreductase family iron-sulfur binding subunit
MSGKDIISRRDFLRVLGLSGAAATLAGCGKTSIESGKENVQSFVQPEDFVVPGIGVYYATTCVQCPSRCGVMGRNREGRLLKLEGNAQSVISKGKICALGQATVQAQYNPDRITSPFVKKDGVLVPISWDAANQILSTQFGPTSAIHGSEIAFLTGPIGGHQKALINNFLGAFKSTQHVVYNPLSTTVGRSANEAVYGVEQPLLNLDKANLILSFGNDFLGVSESPVHMAAQYAQFRKAPRGTLIQIEPRMTLTGANADHWYAIKPGTEGVFALGIAQTLVQHPEFRVGVPAEVVKALSAYDKDTVSAITGVRADAIPHIAGMLWERAPSLVLAGYGAANHVTGQENVASILLLNLILQNQNKTFTGQAIQPFPQMLPSEGSFKALSSLSSEMAAGHIKALLVYDTNPVFTSPGFMPFAKNLSVVPFKVAFATHLNETFKECDLVLPLLSSLEDFGTHVAPYQPVGIELGIQQPLMNPLHPETRSFGDLMLELLKLRGKAEYASFQNYYAYIQTALIKAKPIFKSQLSDQEFWEDALSKGSLQIESKPVALKTKMSAIKVAKPKGDEPNLVLPFYFVPSVRADWRDGAHTNLPWLQESPDTLTTIAWDSWVEIHPSTAQQMKIVEGDVIEIKSSVGSVRAMAYLFPGIQPDTVSMPLGQGHTSYGRYADGIGVNPFKIIAPLYDEKTGELAMHATRVSIRKTGEHGRITKDEGATSLQQGRKLVAVVAPDQIQLSKEISHVIK